MNWNDVIADALVIGLLMWLMVKVAEMSLRHSSKLIGEDDYSGIPKKEPCKRHNWKYDDAGELVCDECKYRP